MENQEQKQFKTLAEVSKEYILDVLEASGGNKTKAAATLGITIKTLYNKLHEYGEFDKYAVHKKLNAPAVTEESSVVEASEETQSESVEENNQEA